MEDGIKEEGGHFFITSKMQGVQETFLLHEKVCGGGTKSGKIISKTPLLDR